MQYIDRVADVPVDEKPGDAEDAGSCCMKCYSDVEPVTDIPPGSTGTRSKMGAGRHTKLTVKRPPSYTSDSNHLHNHANRARKSWRSDVPIILPGWGRHTGGSQSIPTQYTRADFGPEAVSCSVHKHITSPNVKPHGKIVPERYKIGVIQKKLLLSFGNTQKKTETQRNHTETNTETHNNSQEHKKNFQHTRTHTTSHELAFF